MKVEERYMWRCLQLALNGKGLVSPNPMVGAVIVHSGKIIGEGFHRCYGGPHAEVNAINSVKNKSLLKDATMYVSLEPCSHHGKTPPCSDLILENQIPNVVVACSDPFPNVAGRGIAKLKEAGVNVKVGLLEREALELNKEFITAQQKGRPYIYLKWAKSRDGFIDRKRESAKDGTPAKLSNSFTQMLVHKKRTEIDAIMVGTNTACLDNPLLNARLWHGHNPTRIVLDRRLRINPNSNTLNDIAHTIVFTERDSSPRDRSTNEYISIKFDDDLIKNILFRLKEKGINSLMVEGGGILLQNFINKELWDEAFIETSNAVLSDGIPSPCIKGHLVDEYMWNGAKQTHLVSTRL